MASSSCVLALLEPPNQFVVLPCENWRSTSRGWTTPRSRTNSSTASAWRHRARVHASTRRARVHQAVGVARQEAVVDEEVLIDAELRIAPLEVAGAVVAHAVAQREVLRARRCADGVGLDEAQAVDGAPERRGREEGAGDRVPAQVVERGSPHGGTGLQTRAASSFSLAALCFDRKAARRCAAAGLIRAPPVLSELPPCRSAPT